MLSEAKVRENYDRACLNLAYNQLQVKQFEGKLEEATYRYVAEIVRREVFALAEVLERDYETIDQDIKNVSEEEIAARIQFHKEHAASD